METPVAQCAIQNMTGTPGLPWITEKMSRCLWKRLLFTIESRGMVEPGMLMSKYQTSFQPKGQSKFTGGQLLGIFPGKALGPFSTIRSNPGWLLKYGRYDFLELI